MIIRILSKAIGPVIIATAVGGGLWYVTGLRADLETAQNNVSVLRESIQEQQNTIKQIQQDQQKIDAARAELNELISQQEQDLEDLESRFSESASGEERDIGYLGREKPTLVENIINSASAEAGRCLEIASGAELTQEELSNDGSPANSECPSLIQSIRNNTDS